MGRSPKVGLDYFRLDVHLDDKFKLIEAEFGLKGFAVVVKLYQRIYGEQGYYCEWNEDVALVFGDETRLGANAVSEIVTASIKRKLFDKNLFDRYQILTSTGIQKWYFEAVGRREQVEVIQEYLLIPVDKMPKNVCINRINASNNPINASRNPHSKAEDSKGEDSREKDSKAGTFCAETPDNGRSTQKQKPQPTPSEFNIPLQDGTFYNVPLENVAYYKKLYPGVDVEQALRNMVGWSMDAGPNRKTAKGIKRFITGWLIKEQDKAGRRLGNANYRGGTNASPQRLGNETIL